MAVKGWKKVMHRPPAESPTRRKKKSDNRFLGKKQKEKEGDIGGDFVTFRTISKSGSLRPYRVSSCGIARIIREGKKGPAPTPFKKEGGRK